MPEAAMQWDKETFFSINDMGQTPAYTCKYTSIFIYYQNTHQLQIASILSINNKTLELLEEK
jgi:hypothetical protein